MPNDFEQNTAQFDPGFAPHLIPFLPTIKAMQVELFSIKNFGQKKLRYKVLSKVVHKAFLSTLGFWVGCILWGGFIKYKSINSPKKIEGNTFLGLTKEDIKDFAYNEEFDAMANYINNYAKDAKYYLGINSALPDYYSVIVEEYKDFVAQNDNFLNTTFTNDVKIPAKFEFLADYSGEQLIELYNQILAVIELGDLSEFLKLYEKFCKNS